MYWRYRLTSQYGFALKHDIDETSIPLEMVKGSLEDFFVVKTYVEFGKLKPDVFEADKKLLDEIVLCSMNMPLDCVTFSAQMIENVDQLLALFDKVTNNRVFKYNKFTINNVAEGKRYFSDWFECPRLNRVAEWVVAEFEQRLTREFLNHLQNKIPLQVDMNPIIRRKAIRKTWKKLSPEEQDKKVVHYVGIFKTMLGLEVNKEKERWIEETFEMVKTQREENNHELLKATEYAMRYKKRKDSTLFIDSVLFPNLDQAGSIVRFMMYYLGKELLSSIGVWDLYEDPSLIVRETSKDQQAPEKKAKKKTQKKKKTKTNFEKNQKPTAGTTENEDATSIEEFSRATGKSNKAKGGNGCLEDIPKTNWEAVINQADDDWIPVDDKKKKALMQKTNTKQSANDSKRGSNQISDSEQKKISSAKKKKKKSISKTRSVNSEVILEEDKLNILNSTDFTKVKSKDQTLLNQEGGTIEPSEESLSSAWQPQTDSQQMRPFNCNLFCESAKSETNLEVRSSQTSLELDSTNLNGETSVASKMVVKEESNSSTRSTKLRAPAKSKPFIHFEANNVAQKLGVPDLASLMFPFFASERPNAVPKKLQTMLLATTNEKERKFYDYLNADIDMLLTNIDLHAQNVKAAFSCIYERIKQVIKKSFDGVADIQSEVYGSFATNLLLPLSDMDICITGFQNLDRNQAIDILQTLSNNLKLFGWCVDVNFIRMASVPVIKIEADPSVAFNFLLPEAKMEDHFKEKFSDEEMASLVLPAEYLQMAGLHTIKVDITVFYYNQTIPENGGIRTSNFISECLKEYPAMRKLVLLLKWIIAAWDMNKIYTAGLSSYCISLLVLSYLQHMETKDHPNPAELFYHMIKYYGTEFDPQKHAIFPRPLEQGIRDIPNPRLNFSIFVDKLPFDMSPLFLADPTHWNWMLNLAQKSDQAPLIFKKLGDLFQGLSRFKAHFAGKEKASGKAGEGRMASLPEFPLKALVLDQGF